MYRTPYTDAANFAADPPHLISVDRGNGTLVGVTRNHPFGPLVGVALPARTTRRQHRTYDAGAGALPGQNLTITVDVVANQAHTTETFVINPDGAGENLVGIGDVELGTPLYVAQHLALVGTLAPAHVHHVELVFGCPQSVWGDEVYRTDLRESLRGFHRFALNGRERTLYITPQLLPQPVMATGWITMPAGVPDPALAGTLIGVIDPGTGTDDWALLRGVRAEPGRAGGGSLKRGLAASCAALWERLRHDDRFPLLRRQPMPHVHDLLPVLDTGAFDYQGTTHDVHHHTQRVKADHAKSIVSNVFTDAVWGPYVAQIARIGVVSGGGGVLWEPLHAQTPPEWQDRLTLVEPHVQPVFPDPLGRSSSVYAVAAGGFAIMAARQAAQPAASQPAPLTRQV